MSFARSFKSLMIPCFSGSYQPPRRLGPGKGECSLKTLFLLFAITTCCSLTGSWFYLNSVTETFPRFWKSIGMLMLKLRGGITRSEETTLTH